MNGEGASKAVFTTAQGGFGTAEGAEASRSRGGAGRPRGRVGCLRSRGRARGKKITFSTIPACRALSRGARTNGAVSRPVALAAASITGANIL
jgi:hypothetical protein